MAPVPLVVVTLRDLLTRATHTPTAWRPPRTYNALGSHADVHYVNKFNVIYIP